jgi:uncharacterized repeat protein (TIGR01451 family)
VTERGKFMSCNALLCAAAQFGPSLVRLVRALCLVAMVGAIWGCGGSAASGPNLAVNINGQGSAQSATFTISIANTGSAAVPGPITLTLSGSGVGAEVTPAGGWSCIPSGGGHGQFATCTNPGPIPPGDGGVVVSIFYNLLTIFTIGQPVNPPTSYGLSVSAEVSAPGNIAAGASDGVTIPRAAFPSSGPSAILNFGLTHAGPSFQSGGAGSYKFAVQNSSDVESAAPIDVTATLPPGFTYVSSSGAGWVCGGGQIVSCTFLGPLVARASTEVTVGVVVDASLSDTVTSNWSTSLGSGAAPSLVMNDLVVVEPPGSAR